jgi:hypothetical protein
MTAIRCRWRPTAPVSSMPSRTACREFTCGAASIANRTTGRGHYQAVVNRRRRQHPCRLHWRVTKLSFPTPSRRARNETVVIPLATDPSHQDAFRFHPFARRSCRVRAALMDGRRGASVPVGQTLGVLLDLIQSEGYSSRINGAYVLARNKQRLMPRGYSPVKSVPLRR